ncbi:PAS domain S-box protein [Chondromyces crocatus]|uniref:histidine kinase n=1 Tax=Chondromyces crocatus TaxID=52 RepID=A0A0K1EBL8_CHOCO|nr:PAS domain S-box protein [Chondromyces crocatus]AKT37978.1 uncharacterized protein CMC5_021190 [Chondromyces crocatus]
MAESPAPEPSPRRFAALLRERKAALLEAWKRRVLEAPEVPEANRLSEPALLDHIPALIDRLGALLDACPVETDRAESLGRSLGQEETPFQHADQRHQERYSLATALRELSYLRAEIGALCLGEGWPLTGAASALVHAALDEASTTLASQMDRAALAEERRVQDVLRENERRLSTTLKSIGDAVLSTDERGRISLLNPVASALTGWSREEALGQPVEAVFRLVDEQTREPVENPTGRALREGHAVGLGSHALLLRRGGGEIAVDDSAAPIVDDAGRATGVVLVFRDVTAERAADAERARLLAEAQSAQRVAESSRERIALLAQVSAIMGSSLDDEEHLKELARLLIATLGDGCTVNMVGVDGAFDRKISAAVNEEIGARLDQTCRTPLPERVRDLMLAQLQSGRARSFDDFTAEVLSGLAPDDPYVMAVREIPVLAAVFQPLCVRGRPLGFITLFTVDPARAYSPDDLALLEDVAERAALAMENARLFREVEGQRARLYELFRQAPVAIAILRGPTHIVELNNPRMDRICGPLDRIGKPLSEAMPELVEQGYVALMDEAYQTGQAKVGIEQYVLIDREGDGRMEGVYVDFVDQPMRNAAGEVEAIIHVSFDVTERVLARQRMEMLDEEARQSEERFRATFEQAAVGVSLTAPDGRMVLANQKFADILGYSTEELSTKDFRELTHPDDLALSNLSMEQLLSGEVKAATLEKRYVRKDGRPVWATVSTSLVRRATGEPDHFIAIVEDITARKEAEAARALFEELVETSKDVIGFATPQGQVLYLNSAGCRLLGLAGRSEARARTLVDCIGPESLHRALDEMLPAVLDGAVWEGELTVRNVKTGEVIPVHQTTLAIRGEGGATRAVAIVARDLREQKRLESERGELLAREKRARAAAEEANELKDHFLATVSHELRTPLNAIMGWTRMLRAGHLPPERHARALETVERNAKAQAQLVEDLLDISRIMSGKLRIEVHPLDLIGVLETALETVRPGAEAKHLTLQTSLGHGAMTVLGDAARLQQVIWNLLSNAIKFTPQGGTVMVRMVRDEGTVALEIEDTGQGIAPDFLPHVFDRFRQAEDSITRSHGGLGLGLAIVKSLVELHGGTIHAESAGEGMGARFSVRLPCVKTREQPPERGSVPPSGLEGHEGDCPPEIRGMRILVVDDEPDARELLVTMLERCGATVVAAASAAEALEAVGRMRPDLLLADIAMPGEDGYSLIRKVRRLRQEQGSRTLAVALTAHARSEDRTRALRAGFNMHVPKPIDPAELVAVIASLAPRER